MTSEEIGQEKYWEYDSNKWLYEIAYQLACLNEKTIDPRATVIPHKKSSGK